jgi:hypothetical protein
MRKNAYKDLSTGVNLNRKRVLPEKLLWVSVLLQAISDATQEGKDIAPTNNISARSWRHNALAHKKSAVSWLYNNKNTGTGSFMWICEALDFSPVRIRVNYAAEETHKVLQRLLRNSNTLSKRLASE